MTVFVPEQFVHTELIHKIKANQGQTKIRCQTKIQDKTIHTGSIQVSIQDIQVPYRFQYKGKTIHTGFIVLSFVQLVRYTTTNPLHTLKVLVTNLQLAISPSTSTAIIAGVAQAIFLSPASKNTQNSVSVAVLHQVRQPVIKQYKLTARIAEPS